MLACSVFFVYRLCLSNGGPSVHDHVQCRFHYRLVRRAGPFHIVRAVKALHLQVHLDQRLLAAAGLYLLTFAGSGMSLNKGDVLVFVCAIGFALHIGYTGVYAGRYPSLLLAALQMAVVGVFSLIASALTEHVGNASDLMEKLTEPNVLWALAVSIGPTSAFAF